MTEAFDEIRFPPELSYGARGGPEFNTTVIVTASGGEARNQNWENGRVKWDVSTAVKGKEDIKEVIAFFRNRAGRARSFRFKDWSDFRGVNEFIGNGNGSGTQFQLRKMYDDGLVQSARLITKPVAGTVQMFIDGAETTDFTLDETKGTVEFGFAPADGARIEANFEFDFPARFDIDNLEVAIDFFDGFVADSITIKEVLDEGVTVEEAADGRVGGDPLN